MVPEQGQEFLHETRYRVQGEAVAVVTGKEMRRGIPRRLDLVNNGLNKVLVVDENNVVRRPVHALQKTVAAVVNAIQHVGEVIIQVAADGVFRRRRQYVTGKLLRQDQCRTNLLQAEVLRPAVENLAVTGARRHRRVRETLQDGARPRMLKQGFLDVNLVDHYSVLSDGGAGLVGHYSSLSGGGAGSDRHFKARCEYVPVRFIIRCPCG